MTAFKACALACLILTGCVSFDPAPQSGVELADRPLLAILPFGLDVKITTLSQLRTVPKDQELPKDIEAEAVAAAVRQLQREARWLLLSRLAASQGFRMVPPDQSDALAEELQMTPGEIPTRGQLVEFRRRLGADLVVAGNVLDYGKVRWQWMAGGMLADMTWESIVIGLATSWNPAIIFGNIGFELLTSTPLWFGGGYLFGVALRPVRVEARAFETIEGYPVWQSMDESAYARGALKLFPKDVREKKETQLQLNLAEVMDSLADSLTEQAFTVPELTASYRH